MQFLVKLSHYSCDLTKNSVPFPFNVSRFSKSYGHKVFSARPMPARKAIARLYAEEIWPARALCYWARAGTGRPKVLSYPHISRLKYYSIFSITLLGSLQINKFEN